MSADFATAESLCAIPGLAHGFFGKSAPDGSDLNVSHRFAASPKAADAARVRALDLLGPNLSLCALTQIHSSRVLSLDTPLLDRPEADAMVTATPGLALAIVTADCVPVLFADPETNIIAAAHAGWRGAVDGIAGKTIAAMVARGARPDRIVAAIGPAISFENYEIGPDLAAQILALNPHAQNRIGTPPNGKRPHFDVPGFVADDLARAGVQRIERVGGCTYAQPDRYFSHRRFTHTGEPQGRQIALIALTPKT